MARKSVLLDPKVVSLEEATLTEAPVPEALEVLDVELTADSDDFSGMGSTLDRVQLQLDEVEPQIKTIEAKAVALEDYYDLLCRQEKYGYFVSKETFDLNVKTLQLGLEAVERMDTPEDDDDVLEGEYERVDSEDDESEDTKDGKPSLSSRVWTTLKKIWQWLKDTTARALDWIKDYWNKYTEGTVKLKKRLKSLEAKVAHLTGDEVLELRSPGTLFIEKEFVGDSHNAFSDLTNTVAGFLENRFDILHNFLSRASPQDAGALTQVMAEKLSYIVEDEVLLGNVRLVLDIKITDTDVKAQYDVIFNEVDVPETVTVERVNKRMGDIITKHMLTMVNILDTYGKEVKDFTAIMDKFLKSSDPDAVKQYENRSHVVKVARIFLMGNQKLSQYVIKVIKAELAMLEALCEQIGKKES